MILIHQDISVKEKIRNPQGTDIRNDSVTQSKKSSNSTGGIFYPVKREVWRGTIRSQVQASNHTLWWEPPSGGGRGFELLSQLSSHLLWTESWRVGPGEAVLRLTSSPARRLWNHVQNRELSSLMKTPFLEAAGPRPVWRGDTDGANEPRQERVQRATPLLPAPPPRKGEQGLCPDPLPWFRWCSVKGTPYQRKLSFLWMPWNTARQLPGGNFHLAKC